jgi:hypothetical protein
MERRLEIAFDQRADLKQIEFQQSTAEKEIEKSQAAYLASLNPLGNCEYCVIQLLH